MIKNKDFCSIFPRCFCYDCDQSPIIVSKWEVGKNANILTQLLSMNGQLQFGPFFIIASDKAIEKTEILTLKHWRHGVKGQFTVVNKSQRWVKKKVETLDQG